MVSINNTPLSAEEKNIMRNQVRMMFVVYRKGEMSAEQFRRHEQEWLRIAERIRKGQSIIDDAQVIQKSSKEHLDNLERLYLFLLKMLGFYETFFKKMIGTGREYAMLQDKVIDALR